MEDMMFLRRLFTYDDWANGEVADALAAAGNTPPRSARILAHIIGAEWLWMARLLQQQGRLPVWPNIPAGEAARQLKELRVAWQRYFDGLSEAALGEEISYVNTKGEPFRSTLRDILTHVAMHSAYHRGQIAADMRASGLEPVYTDFIHAARQGKIPD